MTLLRSCSTHRCGAIATALAEAPPAAVIVGIDIAERPLEIAGDLLLEADPRIAARIVLRRGRDRAHRA
ncbi:hypothetical protein ASG06_05805 [Rathayibacter sp. Leaf185]|nr:hypothetical protein ASF42_05795 [Rathayibacter sp. Leaf294]KQS13899.1 hypothetical protein ASG06_05805 [Rathayibacter sp. Leaf185]